MSSTSSWFGTDYYHPVDAVDTSRPCKSFRHRDRLASIDLERSTRGSSSTTKTCDGIDEGLRSTN
jgi:hypothetical protein